MRSPWPLSAAPLVLWSSLCIHQKRHSCDCRVEKGAIPCCVLCLDSQARLHCLSLLFRFSAPRPPAHSAAALLVWMTLPCLYVGRGDTVPYILTGRGFLCSQAESAAPSRLSIWASVSLFGKGRYWNLKSKGYFGDTQRMQEFWKWSGMHTIFAK